ncbi:MAG TPA: AMP-binding protein [Pseudonocardiaceae bacterium]|nr:AMP-binding protein [Pseudonocardiaceae bacterium]
MRRSRPAGHQRTENGALVRVIRCDGSPEAVGELDGALRAMLAGGEAVVPLGPGQEPPPEDPGPGQAVVGTSGSAGAGKWVLLGAAALSASAAATHARLGGAGRWLLALPTQHVAGLQVLVRAALVNGPPAILDLRGGFDPAAFNAAATRLASKSQRCYTALVPTQLTRLMDTDPGPLAHFDAVLIGGAAAPERLIDRARAAGIPVVSTYGMTETAGGCVYDGWPLEGTQVRVEDGTGRVELAGPMLATGYLRAPQDAAGDTTAGDSGEVFHDGWFRTCDLGELDSRGRLRVLGRADDVIVTGGSKVVPVEVEAVLASLPGVAAACVVGVPDPEWGERVTAVVIPADPGHPPDPGAVRRAARGLLSGPQVPKEVILLDALPLRGVGKPDRRALRSMLAARNR